MKTSKVLLIVIVVVLINNVLLLSYFFKHSESNLKTDVGAKEFGAQAESSNNDRRNSNEIANPDKVIDRDSQGQTVLSDESVSVSDENVSNAVRQYVQSAEFERVLDNYQAQVGPRYDEMQTRLNAMSASELYSLAIDSSNRIEQKHAQQLLVQNGLGDLSTADLKTLYHTEGVSKWLKQNMLPRLLEDDDPEAVLWAKQLFDDDSGPKYINDEIYSAVYETDPDFIKQHIKDLDLNSSIEISGALQFISRDKDLLQSFYQEGFDKLLDVKNTMIFDFLYETPELDLSHQQQNRLADLFSSKSTKRREFAIRQASNIDDVYLLRDAYSQLSKANEQRSFLQVLGYKKNNTDIAKLIQELAEDSDDDAIRQLLRR